MTVRVLTLPLTDILLHIIVIGINQHKFFATNVKRWEICLVEKGSYLVC